MKQYDKNSLIGLLLMGFILIIFNTYFFPQVEVAETEKEDTTEIVTTINEVQIDQSETEIIADAIVDSIINKQYINQYGIFANTRPSTLLYSIRLILQGLTLQNFANSFASSTLSFTSLNRIYS